MSKATDAAKAAQAAQRRTLADASKATADTKPPATDKPKASEDDAPVVKQRARLVTDNTDGGEGAEHEPAKGDKMLTVNVAKAFRLTQDDGVTVQYKVGAQSMPTSHFDHWYAQAHGVTIAK